MDDELSSIESSMSPIIHPTSFVSTSSLFSLKKIWTSPFPSHTFETISRSAQRFWNNLLSSRRSRRDEEERNGEGGKRGDRRSSFLFALLWRPNNASRSYSSKRDFPRSEGGHGCVNPVPAKFRARNIYIYRKYRNLVSPIFSSRRGWKISFSRRMKTRIQRGEEKK